MYNLKFIIENKRTEMILLAKEHGFTAKVTVRCSQELDRLINLHQQTSIQETEQYEMTN
ncbi:aspartyl-phosphate phosphatase Spo0E family protein [Litchfieldia alkalitelluris]|uniref:aspartyl-phosphate phosphatase Spo0E family protein n=1 Tax=Litchfieldia alkalitelluris TaxID=304268 RepID=UPI001116808E|nr:aspartyl-phosphate phosphatase Spo0E family protein [Litchfieldia alkalitelluris]